MANSQSVTQTGEGVLAQTSQLIEVAAIEVDDLASWNFAPRVTVSNRTQGRMSVAALPLSPEAGDKRQTALENS